MAQDIGEAVLDVVARRQLNREQRQELIRAQLRETPEKSDRQMAGALNLSPTTFGTIRRQMEATGQLSKLDSSIGADGKQYPRKPVTVFNPTRHEEKAIRNPDVVERMASKRCKLCKVCKVLEV